MTDPHATGDDSSRLTNQPTAPARPPRLASPAEPVEDIHRPESDHDLWVAVAAELAE